MNPFKRFFQGIGNLITGRQTETPTPTSRGERRRAAREERRQQRQARREEKRRERQARKNPPIYKEETEAERQRKEEREAERQRLYEWQREQEAKWRADLEEVKARLKAEEEAEKAAAAAKESDKQLLGYEAFAERFGSEWTKEQYADFFDKFGGSEFFEVFGSPVVVEAMSEARAADIDINEFQNILATTLANAAGQGWTQEQLADELYNQIRGY